MGLSTKSERETCITQKKIKSSTAIIPQGTIVLLCCISEKEIIEVLASFDHIAPSHVSITLDKVVRFQLNVAIL